MGGIQRIVDMLARLRCWTFVVSVKLREVGKCVKVVNEKNSG